MRVLLVHGGSDLYGSGLACAWVAEGAVAAGVEIEAVVPRPGPLTDRLDGLGVPVHLVDPVPLRQASLRSPLGLLDPFRSLPALPRLRRIAAEGRFDLVHANTAPALGGLVAASAARAPLVWSIHEILRFRAPAMTVFEGLLGRAQVITTCSRAAADQFRRPTVRSRSRVVYTGARLPPVMDPPPPLQGRLIQLITVGRLTRWKGQDVAVRAVAALVADGIPVHLQIVGASFQEDRRHELDLARMIQDLGLSMQVELLGQRSDVLDLIAEADVFLQPSRSPEPFGIALVEAMALGRVCIASGEGGPAEIIDDGQTGYQVPPGSAGALAQVISSVQDHRDAARAVARRGRDGWRRFDADTMVEQILAIYDETAIPP